MNLFSKLGKIFGNTKSSKIIRKETEKTPKITARNKASLKDFDLEHIDSFLKETRQKQVREFKITSHIKYNEIQKNAQLFEDYLKKLNKANFKRNFGSTLTKSDKAHLNLLKIHRKNFTEKGQNLLKQLRKSLSDTNSIVEYNERVNHLLIDFNKKSMRDFLFFRNLLIPESKNTLDSFKELSSKIREFSVSVWEQNTQTAQINSAQDFSSKIKLEKENISNNKKEIIRFSTKLKNQRTKEKDLEKQINLLRENSEYLKNRELHKKLYQDLLLTKSKIHAQVSSIEHPLKKFIYFSQKSGKITKDKILLTNKFLEDPLGVLTEKDNIISLNLILNRFRDSILENKIELKNKGKITRKLNEILNQNLFEKLILKYKNIQSEFVELEKSKITSHREKQTALEKEIEQIKSNIETEFQEVEQLKKRNSEKEKLIEKRFLELKNVLNSFDFN